MKKRTVNADWTAIEDAIRAAMPRDSDGMAKLRLDAGLSTSRQYAILAGSGMSAATACALVAALMPGARLALVKK